MLWRYKNTARFYEIDFCTKFYNGFILKISASTVMPGFRKLGHKYEQVSQQTLHMQT